MENEQECLIRENQESQYFLQKTITECEDLEREQVYNTERIRDLAVNAEEVGLGCQHLR